MGSLGLPLSLQLRNRCTDGLEFVLNFLVLIAALFVEIFERGVQTCRQLFELRVRREPPALVLGVLRLLLLREVSIELSEPFVEGFAVLGVLCGACLVHGCETRVQRLLALRGLGLGLLVPLGLLRRNSIEALRHRLLLRCRCSRRLLLRCRQFGVRLGRQRRQPLVLGRVRLIG